jgi:hypothetical protein
MQAFHRPRAGDGFQVAARNAEFFFQNGTVFFHIEQAQRRLVQRAALQAIERHLLHQLFELFGNGRLAATGRQVENLFLLFQPLGGMAEIGHHLLDHLFGAVELAESRVNLDDLVGKDARQALVVTGIHQFRFANGRQHALGGRGIGRMIALADLQILLDGVFLFAGFVVTEA